MDWMHNIVYSYVTQLKLHDVHTELLRRMNDIPMSWKYEAYWASPASRYWEPENRYWEVSESSEDDWE